MTGREKDLRERAETYRVRLFDSSGKDENEKAAKEFHLELYHKAHGYYDGYAAAQVDFADLLTSKDAEIELLRGLVKFGNLVEVLESLAYRFGYEYEPNPHSNIGGKRLKINDLGRSIYNLLKTMREGGQFDLEAYKAQFPIDWRELLPNCDPYSKGYEAVRQKTEDQIREMARVTGLTFEECAMQIAKVIKPFSSPNPSESRLPGQP